jgi:hypothetical protein
MKEFFRLTLVVAVLIGLYILFSPFVCVYHLISYRMNGDSVGIERLIDKPVLKDNVKVQFREALWKKMSTRKSDDQLRNMTDKLALDMVDPMIDEMMSLDSIRRYTEPLVAGNISWIEKMKIKIGYLVFLDYKYKSLSEFSFSFYATADTVIEVTLSRYSLISWKIINVTVPSTMLP